MDQTRNVASGNGANANIDTSNIDDEDGKDEIFAELTSNAPNIDRTGEEAPNLDEDGIEAVPAVDETAMQPDAEQKAASSEAGQKSDNETTAHEHSHNKGSMLTEEAALGNQADTRQGCEVDTAAPADTGTPEGEPNSQCKGLKPKLPRPEGVQPCPRCDSRDTKFCYYNNYNIKQPRYFCRGCQRYWTAGGALRDVPVGAGKRKSKAVKPDLATKSAPDPTPGMAAITAPLSLPHGVLPKVPVGPLMDHAVAAAAFAGAANPCLVQGGPPLPHMLPPNVAGAAGLLPQVPDPAVAAFALRSRALDPVEEAQVVPKHLHSLTSGIPASPPVSEAACAPLEDGSLDGRRTRLKTQPYGPVPSSPAVLPASLNGALNGAHSQGLPPPALLSALAAAGAALPPAAGPALAATPPAAGFYPNGAGPAGMGVGFSGPPEAALGPAHLGNAGPVSSEFFAATGAHGQHPHMHPQAAAMAALHQHAQLQQLGSAAAPPPFHPSYGMWQYSGFPGYGPQPGWSSPHPTALQRYQAAYGGLPMGPQPSGAPLGIAPSGWGAGLGDAPPPLSAALVERAMSQVPACGPPQVAPLPWGSMNDGGGPMGWGASVAGLGGAGGLTSTAPPFSHTALNAVQQQGQLGSGGAAYGLGQLAQGGMIPISAGPEPGLLGAVAAAHASDAVVPA